MGRRQKYDIIAEILTIAAMGTKKTRLVYLSNLNFTILKDYLDLLLNKELLALSDDEVCTTWRGFLVLEKYLELKKLLEDGNHSINLEVKPSIQGISQRDAR
jgi:predicted transcriptional regulator